MNILMTTAITGGFALAFAAGHALPQSVPPTGAEVPAEGARAARPQPGPAEAFPTPEAGFAALAEAIRSNDERRLLRILGEQARPLIRSGDPAADRVARDRFAAAYAEKSEILRPAPGRAVLQIGDDAWPLPIPMVARGGVWRFDARQGVQTLVDRRIGRNELDTIEVLRAVVDAQAEYAATAGRQGGFRVYARRLFSTPGQRDGLYWPTEQGEPESPLGPLAAAASAGGYGRGQSDAQPRPFRGYFFRLLERQGAAASGGAMDYVVNGRMIGGFGVIAFPAQYGVSGIKSFLVSHAGIVYQRDLGPDTTRIARSINAFDPGQGWEQVNE